MNSEEYYILSLALHNSISADLINSLLCCLSESLDKLRVDVSQAIFDPVDELLDIFGMPTLRVVIPFKVAQKSSTGRASGRFAGLSTFSTKWMPSLRRCSTTVVA